MTRAAPDAIIPAGAARLARERPVFLLGAAERNALERWELDELARPLVPPRDGAAVPGTVPLGLLAPAAAAVRSVVALVTPASSPDDDLRWRRGGPTIDTVCMLDHAAHVAAASRARLVVWVLDQEHVNALAPAARASAGPTPGAALEAFLLARYPEVKVRRTSDPAARAALAARVTSSEVHARFAAGVRAPFGVAGGGLWWQLYWLASAMALSIEPGPVLAVIDHDQLRAAITARRLDPDVNALVTLPAPQLGWSAPPSLAPERWLAAMHEAPRRMYRAPSAATLCIDEPLPIPRGWQMSAVRQLAWYLTGDDSQLADGRVPDLEACLRTRRERGRAPDQIGPSSVGPA